MSLLDVEPLADSYRRYLGAGWTGVLPLPAKAKATPPNGFTGETGTYPSPEQVATWARANPGGNIALRLPAGVVGIDVDAYKEAGRNSYEALVATLGPLPATWTSTSRTDGVSGIRLYRIPLGVKLRGIVAHGIEAIQRHHRYLVVEPSTHPDTGDTYRWISPDGELGAGIPSPDDLPELPAAWLEALREHERLPGAPPARPNAGEWSRSVKEALADAVAGMVKGSRHDTACAAAAALARYEALEHPGATAALESLGATFRNAIVDRAAPGAATKEWDDIVTSARAKVAAEPSTAPVWEERRTNGSALVEVQDLLGNGAASRPEPVPDVETAPPPELSRDIDDFLAEGDDEYQWLVPGLLERSERIILTGGEGKGKTTLLRQFALRVASGLHPFEHERIDPARALYVDTENPERIARRKWRTMRAAAGEDYQAGFLRVEFRPGGLNLLDAGDIAWLHERVAVNRPELLVIGPLYKLADGDPKDEQPAKAVARCLDWLRATFDIALLIEAHTPYADSAKSKRPLRPYGASLWSRWPEFGICLTDKAELEHWRGPRDERKWPRQLERSHGWPWAAVPTAERDEEDGGYHGPSRCAEDVIAVLAETPGEAISGRRLIDFMRAKGHSYRSGTIRAGAEMAVSEGRITATYGARSSRLYMHPITEERPVAQDLF